MLVVPPISPLSSPYLSSPRKPLKRPNWSTSLSDIQRVKAINVFLYDIYHDQEIIKAGLVPSDLVLLNPAFRPEMLGFVDLTHAPASEQPDDAIGAELVAGM